MQPSILDVLPLPQSGVDRRLPPRCGGPSRHPNLRLPARLLCLLSGLGEGKRKAECEALQARGLAPPT